jgi:hypothetical protein
MSEVPVHSAREALELLRRAAKARQSGSTGMNEHSSRSHAVITVRMQIVVCGQCTVRTVRSCCLCLHMCGV